MRKKKKLDKLEKSFGKLKSDGFHFSLISQYFKNKQDSNCLQLISDKTCDDLDFEDFFMFIDRTNSKIGQQFLYNKLRIIPKNESQNDLKEGLIKKLSVDKEFRLKTQFQLDKLSKDDAFYISSLFQEKHAEPPKWFFLIPLLAFTSLLSLILIPINSHMLFVFLAVFIVNLGYHYWNKRHLNKYLVSIPQLLKLNNVAINLHKEKLFKSIELDLEKSIKEINKIRNRMSFFRLEANLQNETQVLFWSVLELFKIAFLLEPLLLFSVLNRLDSKRNHLEKVFSFIGEIDVLNSIASLRSGLSRYCIPEIDSENFSAEEIYHPLIPNCVSNSINLENKSVLITGSNMSGKTSFIRTIGLNIISGLTINTCFANKISIPRLQIFSAIRISDDLLNDKSYYFEEVLRIKDMIDNSLNKNRCLFLLDEIFKGTNTIERISAGKAVLSTLANNGNIVFVSTHDIELTDLLQNEYELYHFSEIVEGKNVDFDYKLKEGKLKNRNAIRILQINNYPNDLIEEAISISQTLDKK